jgi:hypothetical protein
MGEETEQLPASHSPKLTVGFVPLVILGTSRRKLGATKEVVNDVGWDDVNGWMGIGLVRSHYGNAAEDEPISDEERIFFGKCAGVLL